MNKCNNKNCSPTSNHQPKRPSSLYSIENIFYDLNYLQNTGREECLVFHMWWYFECQTKIFSFEERHLNNQKSTFKCSSINLPIHLKSLMKCLKSLHLLFSSQSVSSLQYIFNYSLSTHQFQGIKTLPYYTASKLISSLSLPAFTFHFLSPFCGKACLTLQSLDDPREQHPTQSDCSSSNTS